MDGYVCQIQMPCRFWSRRLLFMIGITAPLILVFHAFTLPYRGASSPLLPSLKKEEILSGETTLLERGTLGIFSLISNTQNSTYPKLIAEGLETTEINNASGRITLDLRDEQGDALSMKEDLLANATDPMEDIDLDEEISMDLEEREIFKDVDDEVTWTIREEEVVDQRGIALKKELNSIDSFSESSEAFSNEEIVSLKVSPGSNGSMKEELPENSSRPVEMHSALVIPSSRGHEPGFNLTKHLMKKHLIYNSSFISDFDFTNANIQIRKTNSGRLPISVSEMKQAMLVYHSSNHQKWHSPRDKQLLAAKALLRKAPVVKNDDELFEPAFWNISIFKRSYELMERTLKIYVYKEGNKPVFHQPLLRGIYASEGWLMKLLQTDKHFVVRDHRKAHLFYMPFSSRLLQLALYDRKSHSHRNLAQHLKNYVDIIAAKYPYWNRTGGADHFSAACHDWAPHITARSMEASIRALCNADIKRGFKLGKDVSLPEIYIRSARNPLRDLGGNPADNRSTLAFYAGNLHGRLRPILLQHWENKDPDMKILGPMPPGVKSKMIYIQHMKNSKYCICPRGYEVNSPRIVESIYYECVPVIISDYYVPPFFEVLNWEAFSVIIPEEDVPRLKDILVSIPEERYRLLQLGVRRVQQHFLWHNKPVKYDLFHMVLHSLWYNRLLLEGIK